MLCEPVVVLSNVAKYFSQSNLPVRTFVRVFLSRVVEPRDRIVALENINLSIGSGETVGLVGRNGAGKSTLLKLICGISNHDAGYIKRPEKIGAILELGAGFNQEFTGKENAILSARLQGIKIRHVNSYLEEILEFSELGNYFLKPVRTYSSGMYARLAFAVSIIIEPDLLIIDEALSVGDIRFQSKCFQKIDSLKKSGTTIIFVSHDIFSIRRICDRIIWLKDKTVYKDGDVKDVSSLYIEEMYNSVENTSDDSNTNNSCRVWGEDIGIIKDCYLSKDVINHNETFFIALLLNAEKVRMYDGLVLSVSIKDKNGVDIIVLSNFYSENETNTIKESTIKFELKNILRDGDYLVACSIEFIHESERKYLEHRDDACVFRSVSNIPIHGLVLPEFKVEV
ncbi:O-antigen export system ATP-binding protein [Candidatus Photodesmus blepharus]|uniref:O-antigen export system ATP-binding protein n=1 Tax=Candidatus Photodesmus blepharonis TaxID=1179155 RepID=A0A084CMG7_9GAMM|nr:ABC transporter ATP-binding protein [Candidatus Photodesmus blepharus]KEY90996.1 O-antigen export system ATP-binding protein [Candidatus Photodesmus blepharus]